jgi:cytochrome b6-f complex iron-sulfur subunit
MTTKPEPKGESRSRLDSEPVPRRDFLGMAAKCTAGAACVLATVGVLRLPKAAVLPSPSKKFKVSLPESLQPGVAHIPVGRNVAVFRDDEGVFAISIVCTHLGCIVKPVETGFDCPCHGSRFDPIGDVIRGPAPKALNWLAVSILDDGAFEIDEGETVPLGTKVVA